MTSSAWAPIVPTKLTKFMGRMLTAFTLVFRVSVGHENSQEICASTHPYFQGGNWPATFREHPPLLSDVKDARRARWRAAFQHFPHIEPATTQQAVGMKQHMRQTAPNRALTTNRRPGTLNAYRGQTPRCARLRDVHRLHSEQCRGEFFLCTGLEILALGTPSGSLSAHPLVCPRATASELEYVCSYGRSMDAA